MVGNWKGSNPLPDRTVVVTFDDGYIGNYDFAYPYLKSQGIPATFFVHTDYVGVPTSKDHMTWDMLREIDRYSQFSVESHTASHRNLTTLSDYEVREKWKRAITRWKIILVANQNILPILLEPLTRELEPLSDSTTN